MNRPQDSPPKSAYLHVPFCSHRCGYCDFASVAGAESRMEDYLNALEREIAAVITEPCPVDTLFVGGGTPTYLPPHLLAKFTGIVGRFFTLNRGAEFTVESNPNTLTAEKVAVLAEAGVNRVSMGAQSFNPKMLATLERDHDPASVLRAVELLRTAIDNISVDLIFGVPGQTLADWKFDLRSAISLGLQHGSTYGLTYEKGTRLWKQRQLAIVQPIDEELERSMYEHALDAMTDAGFKHYEVSNFGRIDSDGGAAVCRHNLVYWHNEPYHGFGLGAAAFRNGKRTLNTRELDSYIDRCTAGTSPVTQSEELVDEEFARETAMLMLRLTDGLERHRFRERTGIEFDAVASKRFKQFRELGLVADDARIVRLTREGLMVADGILGSFWDS